MSALVTLLGPVASVIGAASHTRSSRTIGKGPRAGETVPVSTDTHGDAGSLIVPDPNRFDGDVLLRTLGGEGWEVLPVSAGYVDTARGVGLHDLAVTPSGTEPRAGGRLAFHVLEVMESVLESAALGQSVKVASRCGRPEAVPLTDLSEVAEQRVT